MGTNSSSKPSGTYWDDTVVADYEPMQWSMSDIASVIPSHLFVRDTRIGLLYAARDITVTGILWHTATYIDPVCRGTYMRFLPPHGAEVMRWFLWVTYWWFQGLSFTSLWVTAHECGHGALSSSRLLCDTLGYILHTALWMPYFSWKFTHHLHHSYNGSMEKDEIFVPKVRSDSHISSDVHHSGEHEGYFEDTPIYTLFLIISQQLIGLPLYLMFNVSGQPHYPKLTSHFNPNSVIFPRGHRNAVILSDAGILLMFWLITRLRVTFGIAPLVKYYGIPWMSVTHWVTMITYLQHTDPKLPRFRTAQWTFTRGATCTVDRDFLGWQGRFFFHDAARYHVIHHFFPQMPFYNCAEATQHLRALIGEHYNYSDAPIFKTLWENFKFCQFVDGEGDIVFYKNRQGKAVRRVAAHGITAPTAGAS